MNTKENLRLFYPTTLVCLEFLFNFYTPIKKNKIFLIYKEIQKRSVSKSYIRKGCHEEMRKYLTIYEEAVSPIYDFATDPV
jgi:hypothetical protein